ncbi:sulfatase-like hydrolase/transferase [Halosimplex rubrum]|uniref:Sulfatase-like hydrolase/transferase n=1 Tax=Halosimplex rubrum TaxID=869889 RepID=A0A7D5T458_9EURY|nr:sulfatase-like hydrolase/transferase [Halosimplex rubrum]QLH77450.1 sulfatase-like hydrolase/transferase [Halosimplex rubrum]
MKLEGKDEFENVLIFVSDALRYDSAVEELEDQTVVKTVASGISSPPGFASIITGRDPSEHGVLEFSHRLDSDIPTIFDLYDTASFYHEGEELGKVLGTTNTVDHKPVEELEPPFLYFERCLIPHAPYSYEPDEFEDSVREYTKANQSQAREDYQRGVKRSLEKFKRRVEALEKRGLLDDTLVSLTADHGQLLGDRGVYGHGSVTSPEVVYVPTVFYNDSVTAPEDGWMAHIDILPTIASAAASEVKFADEGGGMDLFNGGDDKRMIFNQLDDDEWSVWDGSGGILFRDRSLLYHLGWWGYQLSRGAYSPLNRQHPLQLLKTSFSGFRTDSVIYGDPHFNVDEASEFGMTLLGEGSQSLLRDEIDRDHLEDLGYLDT